MVAEFVLGLAVSLAADTTLPSIPLTAYEAPCDLRGTKATCSSTWSAGLHATHVKQHYRIGDPESGTRFFEGIGTYRIAADGAVDGVWADSNGNIHPLDGTWDGEWLVINWGTPTTEQGRSNYHFHRDGSLTVQDSVLGQDGTWRTFMQVTYAGD